MKYSIKRQMMVVFIGLIVFLLLACFVINGRFLEQYYVMNKQSDLTEAYMEIGKAIEDGTLGNDDVSSRLGQMAENGNLSFLVADKTGTPLMITTRNEDSFLLRQLLGYLYEKNDSSKQILEVSDYYEILKVEDDRNKREYIDMWGTYENGYIFIIRSPLESIRESVALANRFLIYVGSTIICISVLLVWYFSRKITDPILELATLSQRMAELDFEAKYTSGGRDEIGVLGANFNTMSEKLEQSIAELKRANYELQKDIEQKEKIADMRNEFLGNVSHELKTPIALIQGYAEGLKEGISDDQESREFYCDVIMDEANKMNQLVKSLLTLNQLEFGNDTVQFERFDITALIGGVLESCLILIQQKGVKVNFYQEQPVYVWADEFKTEQVVRNYISNALNHIAGENVMEICVVPVENEKIRVSVFNTGNRIPEEDVDKIWDKFYKVDKAHTRDYGGNGIGLCIVKAIMESFHQKFGVENYDNGVEFWFEVDEK